jgi:acetoin utilization deacetylase AcuC-like enzyme
LSLHQSPNYPGTGNFTESNCINFALKSDLGGKAYLEMLDKALGMVNLAKIEAVAVSAGFDTHQGDLATLGLVEQDYFDIGKRVANLKKPTFFVLEGGYVGEKVGLDIDSFLKGYEEKL